MSSFNALVSMLFCLILLRTCLHNTASIKLSKQISQRVIYIIDFSIFEFFHNSRLIRRIQQKEILR